ncbi:MAG: 1-acyl-sn-glycerol-3-phosphate acyltransferase [Verrucomicrobia bacterium]|nr:1-acyl-sn-glycerol-3-phosphate acyltransferase [Verrucomicrobiota bacterium]
MNASTAVANSTALRPGSGATPTYWFFHTLARVLARTCFSLRVRGRERLEPLRGRGLLLAANHQSYLDPPLVSLATPWPIHFLARKTLMKWPILGPIFPDLNVIPIDQDRPDMSALKAVIRMVRANQTTIVFPEGSRTLDGELQPAQPGLGLIVAKTLAPVVPMRIFGAFEAMPRNGSRIRAVPIRVAIGEPIFFSAETLAQMGGGGRDLYQRLSEHVMKAIAAIRWDEE